MYPSYVSNGNADSCGATPHFSNAKNWIDFLSTNLMCVHMPTTSTWAGAC